MGMTNTATGTLTITIAGTHDGLTHRERIEGPTPKQAKKMAAHRLELLDQARTALAAGDDDKAFDLDCAAWDIEALLVTYGRNVETGAWVGHK